MKAMALVVMFCAALFAPTASAQVLTPEDGVWWNPAESGRGYSIETQNGTMVVATYIYDAAGNAEWFVSAGTYNPTTRTFVSSLASSRGGQCFGCPYRAPVSGPSGGPITIQFSSATTATLLAGGVAIPIQRFIYNYSLPDGLMFGAWSMSQQTISLVTADWLVFDRTTPHPSGGAPYVLGNRDNANDIVLGRYENDTLGYVFLLDSSTSFWRLYQFKMNKRSMAGRSFLYQKGTNPTGDGVPFFGARIADRYELSLNAPGADGAKARDDREALDAAEWALLSASPGAKAVDPAIAEAAAALERTMRVELSRRAAIEAAQPQ